MSSAGRKARGAYYTDLPVARRLCAWAVRHGDATVLDPSFGDGAFLRAAAERLRDLGGAGGGVFGVELDAGAHAEGSRAAACAGVPRENLVRGDFFAYAPERRFDAVVGNPPFIRYQRRERRDRRRAIARCREAGVELSPLASSWAPFVVHSAALVAPGGRLAMLVPAEIGQSAYARPVLAYLCSAFASVAIAAFADRLFPRLDQDTVVVLAENRRAGAGHAPGDLHHLRIAAGEHLPTSFAAATALEDPAALLDGSRNLRFLTAPTPARDLYRVLESHAQTVRLDALADVTSGYVTGANRFFHLSPDDARELGIPAGDLTRAAYRARALSGLQFDDAAWRAAAARGDAGFLLTPREAPAAATSAYLERGLTAGIPNRYKTRTRNPWFRVPRVGAPGLVMSAMAADAHALARNEAGVAVANTLHAVRPRSPAAERLLLAGWHTSLAALGRELHGRVLGGGMLKLEPGETGRILLPGPEGALGADPASAGDLLQALDRALAEGRPERARDLADAWLLRDALGLSERDVATLRDAVAALGRSRARRPDACRRVS